MKHSLFTLKPIEADATPGAQHRIQIMPKGTPLVVDGRKFRFEDEDLRAVLEDLSARENRIPVIYKHGDGPDGEQAAGWLTGFELDAQGLWGFVEWNPQAAEAIRAKKWRYLSPGFLGVTKNGYVHPRRLLEASLTNIPAIDGMAPVEAVAKNSQEENSMREKLAALLGLAPDTAEEVVIAEAQKLKLAAKKPDPPPAPTPAPAPAPDLGELVRAAVAAERTQIEASVRTSVKAELEASARLTRVEAAVSGAIQSGKVTVAKRASAEKLAKADLDAFEDFLSGVRAYQPGPVVQASFDEPTGENSLDGFDGRQAIEQKASALAKKENLPFDQALGRVLSQMGAN